MAKYRKKPVIIDAIEWNGKNLQDCISFLGDSYGGINTERRPDGKSEITVLTLEGQHVASKGDFLIRGVAGEHYPCKPGIFNSTYDLVGGLE
ncbi:hypothetical protein [Proteus penneri]|uniref:Phage protein n=1 Tax=Proteus penneri TaxID=102862 RepID=A0A0G4Q618_9GAMM|nr:hypothetical protein [Proteus penneri]CRL61240.1 hypothetical protein BN1804_01380 [Proteus penneri]